MRRLRLFHKHRWYLRAQKWETKGRRPFVECRGCGKKEPVGYTAPLHIDVSPAARQFGERIAQTGAATEPTAPSPADYFSENKDRQSQALRALGHPTPPRDFYEEMAQRLLKAAEHEGSIGRPERAEALREVAQWFRPQLIWQTHGPTTIQFHNTTTSRPKNDGLIRYRDFHRPPIDGITREEALAMADEAVPAGRHLRGDGYAAIAGDDEVEVVTDQQSDERIAYRLTPAGKREIAEQGICPRCNGSGEVEAGDLDENNRAAWAECPKCDGTGRVPQETT
jgi:hypothetical protein